MTTPIDEEAEIRRLERETEGLKMLTAQRASGEEQRSDERRKTAQMLVAQNSLGPVCPVPLTVRGIAHDDHALGRDARVGVHL